MNTSAQIAKHFREVHFGGNWTVSNLKEQLADVTWQQATTKVGSFNTILTLVYHTHYYVDVIINVLEGTPLNAKDEYSFQHPPVQSQKDWDELLNKVWTYAEKLAGMIENIPENKWGEIFVNEKYGIYYRNLHGLIEHTHYHLGQIALLKKMV